MLDRVTSASTVQAALREATGFLCCGIAAELESWVLEEQGDESDHIESPIEAIFALWWQALELASRVQLCPVHNPYYLWLYPQHEITAQGNTYRLDFAVYTNDPRDMERAQAVNLETPLIAVELDGHDFHEKTKAQVAYRNQRDRDLQMAGWKVFHFSGSEIVSNPIPCVIEVRKYAYEMWHKFLLDLAKELTTGKADAR